MDAYQWLSHGHHVEASSPTKQEIVSMGTMHVSAVLFKATKTCHDRVDHQCGERGSSQVVAPPGGWGSQLRACWVKRVARSHASLENGKVDLGVARSHAARGTGTVGFWRGEKKK